MRLTYLLRIVQPGVMEIVREDHGCSHNGAGKAATPCFITTGLTAARLKEIRQHSIKQFRVF
jgi:hypothetical protein